MSTIILTQVVKKLPPEDDRLPHDMRKRQPVKEILNQRMKQVGRNTPAVARRAAEKGFKLSESSLKMMLTGATQNPGLFTVESVAQGMDLSTLQFVAELLGVRSDDPALQAGRFGTVAELYKELTPSQRQKADPFVDGLQLQLQHIKNQK